VIEKVDTVIIGAGIVGAGVAYALAGAGIQAYVVEAAARPATGTTSRNSGVIHAGIHYPPESLKTRLCRRGAELLYAFAREHDVPHEQTGKFIVANDAAELAQLDWLAANVRGVPLHRVSRIPAGIRARGALFSPRSGLIDAPRLTETLLTVSGLPVLYNQRVSALRAVGEGIVVTIDGEAYLAARVINCTGLAACRFVAGYRHFWARGSYFRLKPPNQHSLPALVYPAVPKESPGLGIHLTRNLYGETYLGPDLEWIDNPDPAVDPARRDAFFEAAARYLPWLKPEHLTPGYAGIRPKLSRTRFRDFTFVREGSGGALIHCLGIESPGLTAALAIGEHVLEMLPGSP